MVRWRRDDDGSTTRAERTDVVAGEEPLEIRLDGASWLVTMRTPGDDVDLVHGLLLAEGLITHAAQVLRATYGPGVDPDGRLSYNVLDVVLDHAAGARSPDRDRQRAVHVSASCGICGTASLDALARTSAHPVTDSDLVVDLDALLSLPDRLREQQPLFARTGGVHAAALAVVREHGATLEVRATREDVGRHNAVDKVLGWALREGGVPLQGTVLQVSGRLSYELVQKAAMAGVPVLAAVGAPSAAAVQLAEESGITLLGFSRGRTVVGYTGTHRVRV